MLALDSGSSQVEYIWRAHIMRKLYGNESEKNIFVQILISSPQKIFAFLISSKFCRIMDSTQSTRTESIKVECQR